MFMKEKNLSFSHPLFILIAGTLLTTLVLALCCTRVQPGGFHI